MDKRKLLKILGIVAIIVTATTLVAYAIIAYYGQITTVIPVEQALWIDGKRFNVTITETLDTTYGGCTVYANHTLENRGNDGAKINFVVINITDGQGDLVIDDSVTVSWLIEGESITLPVTISAKTTVEFSIAIHFHYAVMPDTYTVNTQVKPFIGA